MELNELRVGNYVRRKNGRIAKIEREDFAYHVGLANLEDNEPIPLTEEWLLNLGFTLDIGVGVWFSTQKHFPIWNAYSGIPYQYTLGNPSHNINISSVHQLQNLYFALTGEELQLK